MMCTYIYIKKKISKKIKYTLKRNKSRNNINKIKKRKENNLKKLFNWIKLSVM